MNKKGFTLIELLTTIVILGVIAVITVPLFNIYIDSSQVGVVKTSATSYIKQIEYELSTDEATSSPSYFGEFTDKDLNVFGDKPSLVEVEIVNNAVDNGIIVYGDYGVIINNRSVVEVVKGRLFLSINGDSTTYVEVATPYVEKGATAIDLIDGTITPNIITTGTVNTNVVGTYTITYSITNSGSQTVTKTRTVEVVDNDPPVITIIGGTDVVHQIGTAYTDSGATATDTLNGNLTGSITMVSTVNPNVKGDYTVIYTVKDSSGNTATATRNVTVVDSFAPTIIITGSNPYNMTPGVYTELGATATDTLDGNITANIDIISDVNPSLFGVYTVIYSVTDSSGNNATATRTVNVNDATLPTVTFGTNGNATYAQSRNTTVIVTDLDSGVNASSLEYQWTQSTTAPTEVSFTTSFASGATIPTPASATGDWYLWILAKDNSANTRITRTNVFKLDNASPSVTFSLNGNPTYALSHSTNVTVTDIEAGVNTGTFEYQWTNSAVAPVESTFTTSFTNGASFTTPNATGDHYLWIVAKDILGNTRIIGSSVFKVDIGAPSITYGMNGNATYAQSRSTTVTVADPHSGINTSSFEYQWTTSTTAPTEVSFTTAFTNGATINTPASVTGDYYLWILAKDILGNTNITRTNVFKLDNILPPLTFGTNGNATYAKTRSTTVTVSDAHAGVNASSLEYQWTTSTTAPTEVSFTTAFTSGATINSPAGVTGTYYLWILAKDNAGNTNITRSNLFNLDNIVPIITILGSNPHNMFPGTYTDAGATASDNIDGNITANIVVTSNVNPGITGTYTVTYTVSDSSGNGPIVATRTVNVTDSTPPTVTFGTNGSETYAKSHSTTITVTDAESGVNASSLKYIWTTSSSAPAEGAITTAFTNGATINTPAGVTGDYYLWVVAKDNATPNTRIAGTNRFRLDNTVPVPSVTGANPYEISVGGAFTEPGISGSDAHSGYASSTNTVIPTASGSYTITYTVYDNAGNTATATRSFYIWSAWSGWSTTVVTATSTRQVETQMQYQYRDWIVTGSYQCNPYSCNCAYSCGGGCPGTNSRNGYNCGLSYDGRLSGTTCNCEYDYRPGLHSYYYTAGSYAASYNCGTCYDTCTSYGWGGWNGTWTNTASCPAQQVNVRDYTCQTLYRSRTR